MTYIFDVELATKYGLDEAIVLQHIGYWVFTNKMHERNFKDGKYWTYTSIKALVNIFPFWSQATIRRIMDKLREKGLLIAGNYNTVPSDRTLWYTLNDDLLQNEQFHLPKSTNGCGEIGKAIPNILPDIYKGNTISIPLKEKKDTNVSKEKKTSLSTSLAQAQPNPPVPATPLPFTSKEFAKAWAELCQLKKWKKKPQTARDKALKKLARYPEHAALAAIEATIIGDYEGIFPEKYVNQPKAAPQPQTEEAPRYKKTTIEELLGGKK